MLSKCANAECLTSFGDYRRGRLFRFHQSHPKAVHLQTPTLLHTSGFAATAPTFTPWSIGRADLYS